MGGEDNETRNVEREESETPTDRTRKSSQSDRFVRSGRSTTVHSYEDINARNVSAKITMGIPKADPEKLFGKLQTFLSQFGRLHDATSLKELYKTAVSLAGLLATIEFSGVLRRTPVGKFQLDEEFEFSSPPSGTDDLDDVVKWALESKQVLFFDEEEPVEGQPAITCILPVATDSTMQIALVLWVKEPMAELNVLQIELLQTLQRDIAARTIAMMQQERYQKLTSLFDNIVESVPHAIIAIGGDDRVMSINSNAEFLFNVQRIFVIDDDYHLSLPETLVETFEELISANLLGDPITDTEIELDLDGVTINVGISLSFLRDASGQPQGYLFLCRDLSLSREVQKLRELDQMKSEFVNTVSHELKTPLTAILGGLEVLEDDLDQMPEDARDMIEVITSGAHRLKSLIFDLLDVSKLEGGRVKLDEALVDVRDVIAESLTVQQAHPNHEIVVEVDDDVEPIVMDQAKILQCVTNFVSNAIKYSPDGGQITVRARRDMPTRMLIVGVTDQGMGIAPQHLEKVWEKFYRIDASYTSQIEGTGLGLVIVRRIIELHGGTTWIESEVGKGSTFFLQLPLRTTL